MPCGLDVSLHVDEAKVLCSGWTRRRVPWRWTTRVNAYRTLLLRRHAGLRLLFLSILHRAVCCMAPEVFLSTFGEFMYRLMSSSVASSFAIVVGCCTMLVAGQASPTWLSRLGWSSSGIRVYIASHRASERAHWGATRAEQRRFNDEAAPQHMTNNELCHSPLPTSVASVVTFTDITVSEHCGPRRLRGSGV